MIFAALLDDWAFRDQVRADIIRMNPNLHLQRPAAFYDSAEVPLPIGRIQYFRYIVSPSQQVTVTPAAYAPRFSATNTYTVASVPEDEGFESYILEETEGRVRSSVDLTTSDGGRASVGRFMPTFEGGHVTVARSLRPHEDTGRLIEETILTQEHPDVIKCQIILKNDIDAGTANLRINDVYFRGRGAGMGTEFFTEVAGKAYTSGANVQRIELFSAQSDPSAGVRTTNGSQTWPKFGFDGDLTYTFKAKLPAELAGAQTVQQLLKTPAGRLYWFGDATQGIKPHAVGMDMTFDLSKGSQSLQILKDYVEKRAASGTGIPVPDWLIEAAKK
jgi:hypothetical protein